MLCWQYLFKIGGCYSSCLYIYCISLSIVSRNAESAKYIFSLFENLSTVLFAGFLPFLNVTVLETLFFFLSVFHCTYLGIWVLLLKAPVLETTTLSCCS